MGSELTCPCASDSNESDNRLDTIPDNESVKINRRLSIEDIIFNYTYGLTKINLIKTEHLDMYFKCRSVLRLANNKEVISMIT